MPADDSRFAPPPQEDPPETFEAAEEGPAPMTEEDDASHDPAVAPDEPPLPKIRVADEEKFDVDSALAAVSGLDEMLAQEEAEERAEQERIEAEAQREQAQLEAEARRLAKVREAEEQARLEAQSEEDRLQALIDHKLPAPAPLSLHRFSIASLLPGLALVTVGIWLTFAYATGSAPEPQLVSGVLGGLVVLALVSVWLATGRWSRGTFFFGFGALLVAGTIFAVLSQFDAALLPAASLVATGMAVLLTGLLARPAGRVVLPGLLLIVAGAVVAVSALGLIPTWVLGTAAAGWIGVLVVFALLLMLPLLSRRRN